MNASAPIGYVVTRDGVRGHDAPCPACAGAPCSSLYECGTCGGDGSVWVVDQCDACARELDADGSCPECGPVLP